MKKISGKTLGRIAVLLAVFWFVGTQIGMAGIFALTTSGDYGQYAAGDEGVRCVCPDEELREGETSMTNMSLGEFAQVLFDMMIHP